MEQENVNRRSKDSVFTSLFSDTNYVLELYKDLHPEDGDVTVDDIEIKTLKSVLINTQYNDLGFMVKDKLVVLVEAQSTWNPNIALRMFFYLSETYRRYIFDTDQSEHSTVVIDLPMPELYVVYTGEKDVPGEVSFSEVYFGGRSPVDLRVKIFRDEENSTIYGQYIGFCKVFDEQRKIHPNKIECVKETIRICIERGYLAKYLKNHEKEAVTMMEELFDEEFLRNQYDKSERKRNLAIGIAEGEARGEARGRAEGEAKGKAETARIIADNLRRMGLSEEQIKEATSV